MSYGTCGSARNPSKALKNMDLVSVRPAFVGVNRGAEAPAPGRPLPRGLRPSPSAAAPVGLGGFFVLSYPGLSPGATRRRPLRGWKMEMRERGGLSPGAVPLDLWGSCGVSSFVTGRTASACDRCRLPFERNTPAGRRRSQGFLVHGRSAPPLPQKRPKLAGQIRRQPFFLAGAMEKDQDRRGFAVDLPGFESGQQVESQRLELVRPPLLREQHRQVERHQRGVDVHLKIEELLLHRPCRRRGRLCSPCRGQARGRPSAGPLRTAAGRAGGSFPGPGSRLRSASLPWRCARDRPAPRGSRRRRSSARRAPGARWRGPRAPGREGRAPTAGRKPPRDARSAEPRRSPARRPSPRPAAGCEAPNFPAERQNPLRSYAEIFGPPNFLTELRRKIWPAKFRRGAPKKNPAGHFPPRSSRKKFGAPNFPAELRKKIRRAESAGGGPNFSTELQIRLRSVARPGIGRNRRMGRFRRR